MEGAIQRQFFGALALGMEYRKTTDPNRHHHSINPDQPDHLQHSRSHLFLVDENQSGTLHNRHTCIGEKVFLCFSRNFCSAIRNEFYLFLSHMVMVGTDVVVVAL